MSELLRKLFTAKTQADFSQSMTDLIDYSREWLQTNGELGFLVGFGIGVIALLFYKIVLVLLAISILLGALWWAYLDRKSGPPPVSSSIDEVSKSDS